jgi:hypothetical protein
VYLFHGGLCKTLKRTQEAIESFEKAKAAALFVSSEEDAKEIQIENDDLTKTVSVFNLEDYRFRGLNHPFSQF